MFPPDPSPNSSTSEAPPHAPRAAVWFLKLLGRPCEPPPQPDRSLDGVLRWTAASLAIPFPPLLAFGELDDDGWLRSVPPVEVIQKALASAEVPTAAVLVDPDRAVELRTLFSPGSVRVLGVRSFAEALSSGLALLPLARDGILWAEDIDTGWTAERLFAIALESSTVPCGWPLLAGLSVGLLHRVRDSQVARWKTSLVRDIARRHAGEGVRIDCPAPEILEALPSEVRWRLLAHLVQSVADSDVEQVQESTALALDALEQSGSLLSPGKAALRGALGRALAAARRYQEATIPLRQAVEDWERLDPPSASYALCELLRVLGILGVRAEVLALRERVRVFLAASGVSSAFVGLAWGRALFQCGEVHEALEVLELPRLFEQAPMHALTSRFRWLIACQRRVGRDQQAQESTGRLEALGDSDQLHLARLDALLEAGSEDGLEGHAQALLASAEGAEEALRLLSRLAPGKEPRWAVRDLPVLRCLCEEYRY